MDDQIDASIVIEVQQQKINDLTWQVTILTAQLNQLQARQQSTAGGMMGIGSPQEPDQNLRVASPITQEVQ